MTEAEDFIVTELVNLWHDLDHHIRFAANGYWSMACERTVSRIIAGTRIVGPADGMTVPWRLLMGGVYQAVHDLAGIPIEDEPPSQQTVDLMSRHFPPPDVLQADLARTVEAIRMPVRNNLRSVLPNNFSMAANQEGNTMNREQMVAQAAGAISSFWDDLRDPEKKNNGEYDECDYAVASRVLDTVLPQIKDVSDLALLSRGAMVLVLEDHESIFAHSIPYLMVWSGSRFVYPITDHIVSFAWVARHLPLTVVWTP